MKCTIGKDVERVANSCSTNELYNLRNTENINTIFKTNIILNK